MATPRPAVVRLPVPLTPEQGVQVRQGGEVVPRERLLRLAGQLAAAAEGAGATVGICTSSQVFLLAAALGLWKLGKQPLVLDPTLQHEPDRVLGTFADIRILASTPTAVFSNIVVVDENPSAPMLAPVWPDDEQTAALFLTSGSSGEPKVIRKRAAQLYRQLGQELAWLEVGRDLTVYSMVPPFHILGFVYGLFLPLLGHGVAAYSPGAGPAVWGSEIRQLHPDAVIGVPSHYRFLAKTLSHPLPKALYFSSGAPLSPEVDQLFSERSGQSITQGYGSTETGGIAKRTGFGSWTPFPGLTWRIGPDQRLVVKSPWQESPDEWYVTDDVVEKDGQGFRLLGRADSIIKVGGKRFSTNEVVAAAQAVPEVDQAAAITYQRYGETAVALCVTARPRAELSSALVRAALCRRLAPFKLPRAVLVIDSLPCMSNGKLDQARLRALVQSSDENAAPSLESQDE